MVDAANIIEAAVADNEAFGQRLRAKINRAKAKQPKMSTKALFYLCADVYRELEAEGLVEPPSRKQRKLAKQVRIICHRGKNRGKRTVICPIELEPQMRMALGLKPRSDARLPPRHR